MEMDIGEFENIFSLNPNFFEHFLYSDAYWYKWYNSNKKTVYINTSNTT